MPEEIAMTNAPGPSTTAGPGEVHPESATPPLPEILLAEGEQQERPVIPNLNQEKNERPKWETAETLEDYWYARKTFFTEEERAKAWDETANIVKKYSDEMVDRWNKEIDTLLVFAGLFSAILTAFNVQSYQLLMPAPPVDPVIVALEKISAQLSSFSVNPPSVNSTQPAFVRPDPTPSFPPLWAVWLNALWFSSLIFSLSAASVGIMVKQWLNEYNSGLSGTSRQIARLRQLRLNSLQRWHVKEIVAVLPVLLQIASALFFAGLLILLWQLNRTVAIVASVLVGVLAFFSISTIVLPSFATHCSYLSPPSRALYELTRPLRKLLYPGCHLVSSLIVRRYCSTVLPLASFEKEEFQKEHPHIYSVWKLINPDINLTLKWRGMELSLLSELNNQVDGDMVATAYTTGMNTDYLHHAAVHITDLPPDVSRQCFQAIVSANVAHWGKDRHHWSMRAVHPCLWSGAIVALMMAPRSDIALSQSSLADALKTAYRYIDINRRHAVTDIPWTRLVCADFVRIIYHYYDHDKLPPGELNIAEKLLELGLPLFVLRAADIGLGNDIRRYVASACQQEWNRRRTSADEDETRLALNSLQCTICCIPSLGSPDYKPNDPEYQAMRGQVVSALDEFSVFLFTPRSLQLFSDVQGVFDVLRELHEKEADLLLPKFIEAMSKFLDMTHENKEWEWIHARNAAWIKALERNLLDDSEQGKTPAADNVQSTSLGTSATRPPVVDSTVISIPDVSSPADSEHHDIHGALPASRNSSTAFMTSPGSESTMGSPEGPTVPEVAPRTTRIGNAPAINVSCTDTVEDAAVLTAAGASESPPVDSEVERNGISDSSEGRAPSDHFFSTSTAPS